jgi:hypothetical protein
MIPDPKVAEQISALMLEISGRLDSSVALVNKTSTAEEAAVYRRAVGKILGEILLEVLNPLYAKHPSLKPAGFE